MANPVRRLAPGEELVLDLHPSGRRLVVPFMTVPVLAGLVTYARLRPVAPPLRPVVLVAAAVLLVVLSVVPYLRWRCTRYLVTTHRVLGRSGVLRRVRHDLPLSRVDELHTERGLFGRVTRAGDLVLASDATHGGLRLVAVPRVEHVAAVVSALLPVRGGDDVDVDLDDDLGPHDAWSPPSGAAAAAPRVRR